MQLSGFHPEVVVLHRRASALRHLQPSAERRADHLLILERLEGTSSVALADLGKVDGGQLRPIQGELPRVVLNAAEAAFDRLHPLVALDSAFSVESRFEL